MIKSKDIAISTLHPVTERATSSTSRRRSIIREFALNTSTHALPGIARSQSIHNCIFWTASFVIFTGVMIYFVSQSMISYFQYPTQTLVSVRIDQRQTFPAVTICNLIPNRYDTAIDPLLEYAKGKNITNMTRTTRFGLFHFNLLFDFLIDNDRKNQSNEKYSFSLADMLINCKYNSLDCNESDFKSFISSTHGYCYTFNAKTKALENNGVRGIYDNAETGKLHLELYTHSHLYVPDTTTGELTLSLNAAIESNAITYL